MPRVLILNGALLDAAAPPAAEWLASSPRGAYTTARTVAGGTRVFGLTQHIARLAATAALLPPLAAGAGPAPPAATDPAALRPAVVAGMAAALRTARQAERGGGGQKGDWRLTCLLSWGVAAPPGAPPAPPPAPPQPPAAPALPFSLWVHAAPLPPRPTPPVAVLATGAPRANAGAKDSDWATAGRAGLEAARAAAGVEEVVLVAEGGGAGGGGPALIEGLSSNVAVLEEGAPRGGGGGGGAGAGGSGGGGGGRGPPPSPFLLSITLVAPGPASGALGGTVRTALVDAARRAGLAVEDRPIRVADAGRWVGAFLTSTSRGALPVGEVRWPAGAGRADVCLPCHQQGGGLVEELDGAVRAAMEAAGEDVEEDEAGRTRAGGGRQ